MSPRMPKCEKPGAALGSLTVTMENDSSASAPPKLPPLRILPLPPPNRPFPVPCPLPAAPGWPAPPNLPPPAPIEECVRVKPKKCVLGRNSSVPVSLKLPLGTKILSLAAMAFLKAAVSSVSPSPLAP